MARRDDQEKTQPRGAARRVRVVAARSNSGGEAIFREQRSGRDRREGEQTVEQESRGGADRRKRGVKQSSWWLERDYVESHHFVQNSSSARGSRSRKKDKDPESR